MSLPLAVSNLKEANDTLFHELAHALTPSCGHNNEWKEACVKLGANQKLTSKYNCKTSTFAKTKNIQLVLVVTFTLPSQENHQVVVQNAIKI
jgi:hypothetical protein